MNNSADVMPTAETTWFESEHTQTHRRWAGAVLGLYGIVVSIGILATIAHKSATIDQMASATHVEAARR